ncbi:Uncharacterised protein [Mycobacteroides abscessus subsp. abscessus]|nr:Uncharacterised protein [Mycobacteroides abscessus subsp. abscessus]
MRSSPETTQPPPDDTTSGVASSCSSRTSPTISSIMSSTVTSPAVPPYSSTTSAVCMPLARTCSMTASPSSVDGTTATGRARLASVVVARRSRGTSARPIVRKAAPAGARLPALRRGPTRWSRL